MLRIPGFFIWAEFTGQFSMEIQESAKTQIVFLHFSPSSSGALFPILAGQGPAQAALFQVLISHPQDFHRTTVHCTLLRSPAISAGRFGLYTKT
jgi:hypothetical protein